MNFYSLRARVKYFYSYYDQATYANVRRRTCVHAITCLYGVYVSVQSSIMYLYTPYMPIHIP